MWIAMPLLGLLLTYAAHFGVRRWIFEHENARRRIITGIPYYITFCGTVMFFCSLTQNFYQYDSRHDAGLNWWWYFGPMLSFPILVLVLSRFYMLRRGRELNKISLENVASQFLKE